MRAPQSSRKLPIHDRTASRVALVDFVVADPERARKVKALYVEIERLMLEAQHTEARELGSLGHGCHCAEEEVRASVAASRTAELAALERYIGMELAIRSLTTPEEFAALDRIK